MNEPGYEEAFGSVRRRAERLRRALAWRAKGIVRAPRTVLVETRWRLGDEIMALAAAAALRDRWPRDRVLVWSNHPELYDGIAGIAAASPPLPRADHYLLLRGASRRVPRMQELAARAGVMGPLPPPRLAIGAAEAPPPLPPGDGPLIAMAPGTTWLSKQWPADRWRALAAALEARGARVAELGRGHAPVGAGMPLVDRTRLRAAAAVLRQAALLVSCDSGLMHLALAVGTPAVALFGPTDPAMYVGDHPLLTPLRSALPCAGLWHRADRDYDPGACPYGHACCLGDIAVETVLDAVLARADGAAA